MINLDAYFSRIGFGGEFAPTLSTLQALHQLHPASIPFENIDVLLDRDIDIDTRAVETKLVTQGRGGYCFEQNGFFLQVLRSMGFEVEPLIGRVMWMLPDDAVVPRTHMVLRVRVEDQWWLSDVGFGGLVLTRPLLFATDQPQSTGHELFRVIPTPHRYRLEAHLNQRWQPVYQLSNEPQQPVDFEVANWYTSKHPSSKFRHHLMLARATSDTRYTLLNNQLTIREKEKEPVKKILSAAELEKTLGGVFLLPVTDQWRSIIDNAVSKSNPGT